MLGDEPGLEGAEEKARGDAAGEPGGKGGEHKEKAGYGAGRGGGNQLANGTAAAACARRAGFPASLSHRPIMSTQKLGECLVRQLMM